MRKPLALFAAAVLLAACAPSNVTQTGEQAPIYPDYTDITIPSNIAPLNFKLKGNATRTILCVDGRKFRSSRGSKLRFNEKAWRALMAESEGKTLEIKLLARGKDGWKEFAPFTWTVSADKIDPYLTYRLIEPSFQMWHEVSIMERCIENFDETTICDYKHTDNACMNCHTHVQQRGDLSFFYIRGPHGGTILNRDGKLRKLTLNAPGMLSGTVYGEIHPSGRFGVFSTNIILPSFHTTSRNRMEVYDSESDLTVADFDNNRMINLPHVAAPDKLETFPCFSADGESVFYCVADSVSLPDDIGKLRYSLVRAAFNSESGEISDQIDTVWSASAHNGSVCHPKTSPDGRWLMFTVAEYGTFPIDHGESTIQMIDLETGELNALAGVKKDESGSDTYHSWSSDGKWFVFASKRGDGQFAKPYFCHLDSEGNPSKPFVLPQKSSRFYELNLKSFNVPDLGSSSTGITVKDSKAMFDAQSEVFE